MENICRSSFWVGCGFIFLLLFASGCGQNATDSLASPSQFSVTETSGYPAVVKVVGPNGSGLCTGTFVSPRAVLTAAHCTLQDGSYWVLSSFGTFQTSNVQRGGNGNLGDDDDIAILYFDSDKANPANDEVYALGSAAASSEEVRLIGYGCNDLDTRSGSGVKRTGTNQVYRITSHIELLTPRVETQSRSVASVGTGVHGILGPENRAATCFGDSGSPLLRAKGRGFELVGVGHAGGWDDDSIVSQFSDINRSNNYAFIQSLDQSNSLGIIDICQSAGARPKSCSDTAASGIVNFLRTIWASVWNFILALF